ncbi:MAG: hypothetical protein MK116_13505 [Phycisphaerales bacterium]|nr:hypothetical protein [Phycisphaerales bacterium]
MSLGFEGLENLDVKICLPTLLSVAAMVAIVTLGLVGCELGSRRPAPPARVVDLSHLELAQPHHEPIPAQATTKAFVPWDDSATLAVLPDHEELAGALVVLYGKSWSVNEDDPGVVYVLESAGSNIEPISLQWHPAANSELRAIARVDGELQRYDFSR